MQYALIVLACSLMSIAVMAIAATSLAVNCYSETNKKETMDFKFFIANLIITTLFLFVSFSSMYLAFNDKKIAGSFPTIQSR